MKRLGSGKGRIGLYLQEEHWFAIASSITPLSSVASVISVVK